MLRPTAIAWVLLFGCASLGLSAEWVDLFDGESLAGWEVHSGFAKYEVTDGMIVGTAVEGSPNTFLCTKKEFGDFILEFEVWNDPALNSGVQFRSQIASEEMTFEAVNREGRAVERKIPADRVFGYQVEIAKTQGQSGNVYDEARRGKMLDDFTDKTEARAAFKDDTWNRYMIVCKGNSIRTWINGVPCAEFEDDLTAKGVLGLQVHGVRKDRFQPYQVRWRNLRLLEFE